MTRRFLHEEGGFTLTEMIVTLMLMLMVMFALYSLFDMSLKVFAFGNDKVEATERARLGLDKMARELRAAYPADPVHGKTNVFWAAGAPGTALTVPPPVTGPITFGNDRNGNHRIYDDSTGALDSNEQITYSLSGSTLQRNGDPVAGDVTALTFTYLDENGVDVGSAAASTIRTVRIRLVVTVNRGGRATDATQTLQTDVTLRNRSG